MVITQPTVDDFSDTTVMRVIRKIVNYICSDSGLVAQINDNDITGFTSSYINNLLKIDATKGDGTTIPVCSLTIQGGSSTGNPYPTAISGTVGADGNITFTVTMSSGNPLTTTINMNYFASADDLSDLQEQVVGIKPTITVNDTVSPPTITVAVNGKTSTANLPASTSGGGKWKDLDLSSFPTDFKEGDELLIFYRIATNVTSISNNTSFDSTDITISDGGSSSSQYCMHIVLSTENCDYYSMQSTIGGDPHTSGLIQFSVSGRASDWNRGLNSIGAIVRVFAFNKVSAAIKSHGTNTVIHSIKRKV